MIATTRQIASFLALLWLIGHVPSRSAAARGDETYLRWTANQAEAVGSNAYRKGRVGGVFDTRILKTERAYNYKLAATWLTPDVIRATARLLQLRSRLEVLLLHLLKRDRQPDRPSPSWESTIIEQRARIQGLLEDSPSLRPGLAEAARRAYPVAANRAAVETGLGRGAFPAELPYRRSNASTRILWKLKKGRS